MVPFLAVTFIVVPILELAVLIAVAREIGGWWTILLVILVSIAGAWLARREGTAAWRRFQAALFEGRMPTNEVADGAMVLLAAALLLTPGFLSDILAIALLIPPIRAVIRARVVRTLVARSLRRAGLGGLGLDGAAPRGRRRPRVIDGEVIDGEVIDGQVLDPDGRVENGFGRPGRSSSTQVAWGEPEADWKHPDDREPPPASGR